MLLLLFAAGTAALLQVSDTHVAHAPRVTARVDSEMPEPIAVAAGSDCGMRTVVFAKHDDKRPWQPSDNSDNADEAKGIAVELVAIDALTGGRISCRLEGREHVTPGELCDIGYAVSPPPGFVAETFSAQIFVSKRARHVRLTAPLRREVPLNLQVLGPDGNPVADATLGGVYIGAGQPLLLSEEEEEEEEEEPAELCEQPQRCATARAEKTDAGGWACVRGVPFYQDERLWIVAGTKANQDFASLILGSAPESLAAVIRLKDENKLVFFNQVIGLSGGSGCGFRRGRVAISGVATLELQVVRRDGSRVRRVRVHLTGPRSFSGDTDENGLVTFYGVAAGRSEISVRDRDFLYRRIPVTLAPGEYRRMELVEPGGWRGRVLVLDSRDVPVPHAAVRVVVQHTGFDTYNFIVDRVQELALYTDTRGELSLPRLPHTTCRIEVTYGSRDATADISESKPSATIRLPAPG